MEMLKEKLCQFFKYKLDGARFYIGKPMPEVHKNLGITNEVFDSACEVFVASLEKFNLDKEVFDTFVNRISSLRPDICFPKPKEEQRHEMSQPRIQASLSGEPDSDSLLARLGEEVGLRNIVDSLLEQARLHSIDIFSGAAVKRLSDDQLISRYTTFLASIMDARYNWFLRDLIEMDELEQLQVESEDFDVLLGYLRTACVKNAVSKPTILKLIDFL